MIVSEKHRRTLLAILINTIAFAVFAQIASARIPQEDKFPPTNRLEFGIGREVTGLIKGESGVLLPISVRVFVAKAPLFQPYSTNRPIEDSGKLSNLAGGYAVEVKDDQSLLFVSRGFAPLWVTAPDGNTLDVELSQGRSVTGTILSPDGDPVSGAQIKLVNWFVPRPPDQYIKWGQDYGADRNVLARLPNWGSDTVVHTDANGHFEIKNLPKEFRVALSVSAPGLKQRIIFVRAIDDGVFDSRAPDFTGQVLLEDDFEVRLEKSSVLRISGFEDESGQPAKIRSISIDAVSKISNLEVLRKSFEINDTTGSIDLQAYPKGLVAWIEPVDNDRLLGYRLTLPPNADGELIEEEVQFKTGKTLRGIVKDERTGEPIPDVPLVWRTKDMQQVDSDESFAPLRFTTEKSGTFEVAVPKTDGIFGVAGDIPGYQSAYGWNRYEEHKENAPEVLERFTREISGEEEGETPFEFLLLPSFRLNITTLSEDGNPIGDCAVFAKVTRPKLFQTSSSIQSVSARTNSSGEASFTDWCFDSYQLASARKHDNDGPGKTIASMRFRSRKPSRLIAFSDGGIFQGSAVVPIPDSDAETNEIEVAIEMKTTGNVTGSGIGIDGEQVAGIWIRAVANSSSSINAGLGWWTMTRDDGRFLLKHLPVGMPLDWSVDSSKVKAAKSGGRIEVDIRQIRSGETLEVPPVVVINLSALAEPLAEIDLDSLGDADALQALDKYAKEYLAKLPQENKDNGKFFRGQSHRDAGSLFVQKLEKKLEPLVIKLADRDPGGEYEMKVLAAASSWFHDPRNTHGAIDHAQSLNRTCHARLLENHIDNELAQDALIRYTIGASQGFRFTIDGQSKGNVWRDLRDRSPFKKTKAVAGVQLLFHDIPNIMGYCDPKFTEEQFKTQFLKLKSTLSDISDGLSELDERSKLLLKYRIDSLKQHVDSAIKRSSKVSLKRWSQISEVISPLIEKP